ncbi:hypothetical protein [Ramlibacter sp. AN1133]|uniref:hypothetical protein n=1 Tax=Ramlibacter sp. AN1133 TaxID=3133429 RepID=UPI0030C58578
MPEKRMQMPRTRAMPMAMSENAAKPTMNSAGWMPALAKKPIVPALAAGGELGRGVREHQRPTMMRSRV